MVAAGMTVMVVDLFESVQVHEKQGHASLSPRTLRAGKQLLHPAFHRGFVQQPGQRVLLHQFLQLGIDLHDLLLLLQHHRGVVGMGQGHRQCHRKGDGEIELIASRQQRDHGGQIQQIAYSI